MDGTNYMSYTDRRLRNSLTPSRSNDLFANLGKNILSQPYQTPGSYQSSPIKASPYSKAGYSDQFLAQYNQQDKFQKDYADPQEYRKNLTNKLSNIRNNRIDFDGTASTKSLPAIQRNIFDNPLPSSAINPQIESPEKRFRYQKQNSPLIQTNYQNPAQFQPEPEWNPQPLPGYPAYPSPNYFQQPYGGYPNLYGGAAYYGQPLPNNQPKFDPELKYQFERQNSLLEKLNKNVESRPKQSHYNHDLRSSENFNRKIQELEKANEIKMKLFNQQQMIQNLSLKKSAPNYIQPFLNDRDPSPAFLNQGPDHRDDIINFQNSLINNLMMPEDFVQTLLERAAPNPYYIPPYMNQQYYPPPPQNYHRHHRTSDRSKKKKKTKKDKKTSPDASFTSETSDKDGDKNPPSSKNLDIKKDKPSKTRDDNQRRDSKPTKTPPKASSKRKSTLDNESDQNGDDEEDQEQQRLLAEKKKNAKRNLRLILWSSVYPIFLNLEVTEKVDQRKKAQNDDLLKNDEATEKELVTWIHTLTQKGFDLIFNEKNKNYDFIGSETGGRPINSDIKTRATNVKDVVKTLLENLVNNTKTQPLKEENLNYLAALTLGELYGFNNKFSSFEIDRINFNSYGRFMNLSREQSGMIVVCTLLIRMLIYQLLLNAKEWHDQIQWTDRLPTNLKIIASVIYRIAMLWINDKVKPINPEEVNSEGAKKPVIPMPPLKAGENVEATPDLEKSEIILGLYTAEDLRIILDDKTWLNPIQSLIVNWAAGIYFKLVEHRKTNPKKEYK